MRGRVEVSNARLPRGFYRLLSILVRSFVGEVANDGGTEANFSEGHVGVRRGCGYALCSSLPTTLPVTGL